MWRIRKRENSWVYYSFQFQVFVILSLTENQIPGQAGDDIFLMGNYYVYIVGNSRPTLYIGVTSDIVKRIYEHKQGVVDGFTKKYGLKKLLYFETFSEITIALEREKQLKHWNRVWKLELIKKQNPMFKDLYSNVL